MALYNISYYMYSTYISLIKKVIKIDKYMFSAGFIVFILFVFGLDLTFIFFLYKYWIKYKRILLELKTWKGTKKPYIWFFVWSFLIIFNVPLLILIYIIMFLTNLKWIFYIFILSIFVYPLILGIAYCCIKSLLKDKEFKKGKKNESLNK